MARRYHTLAVWDCEGQAWGPQFGAYDRQDVDAELEDYRDHGHAKKDLKLITTSDTQAEINAAVAKLNEGV